MGLFLYNLLNSGMEKDNSKCSTSLLGEAVYLEAQLLHAPHKFEATKYFFLEQLLQSLLIRTRGTGSLLLSGVTFKFAHTLPGSQAPRALRSPSPRAANQETTTASQRTALHEVLRTQRCLMSYHFSKCSITDFSSRS